MIFTCSEWGLCADVSYPCHCRICHMFEPNYAALMIVKNARDIMQLSFSSMTAQLLHQAAAAETWHWTFNCSTAGQIGHVPADFCCLYHFCKMCFVLICFCLVDGSPLDASSRSSAVVLAAAAVSPLFLGCWMARVVHPVHLSNPVHLLLWIVSRLRWPWCYSTTPCPDDLSLIPQH